MIKGNIVLIPFPFTDLTGNKLRPALVLASTEREVIVAFITSQIQWTEEADIILQPIRENGLKKESLLRLSKLVTLDKELLVGLLGKVDDITLKKVN